ncbi:MAG: pyridoxal phosphate-dependent aminotransferase [Mycobacteriales bacterium]
MRSVDLSANTNAWGCPPAARAAVSRSFADSSDYPSRAADDLRHAVAERLGVTVSMVTTGCGSDDVLATAFRVLAQPGETLVAPFPTFAMVEPFALSAGLRFAGCAFGAGFSLDVDAITAKGAAVAYLCSPNNPTGTALEEAEVRRLLERFNGYTVLDEAYIDYGGRTSMSLVREHERLLVVRTFSKAFGLAGLRVGYAVGAPAVISRLEAARGPYKVGVAAERAAVAVLGGDGRRWVDDHVLLARACRRLLQDELGDRGIAFVPSHANFVLVPVPDAASTASLLAGRGLTVRQFPDLPGLGDAVRITVGPEPLMVAVAAALEEALA